VLSGGTRRSIILRRTYLVGSWQLAVGSRQFCTANWYCKLPTFPVKNNFCILVKSKTMKAIVLVIGLFVASEMNAQALLGPEMNKVGMIKPDGTVLDESDKLAGRIKKDGMVTDKQSVITGYIKEDGTIENEAHSVVGYVQNDGTILDKDKKVLGYIKEGVVTGGNNETIGYAKGVPVKWAAVYYFFLF
jgi:hypothetical protein